jgi:hypothetical protein
MPDEQKYVVVNGDQRVTDGLTEQEAQKRADELKRRLEESQKPSDTISVKPLLFG